MKYILPILFSAFPLLLSAQQQLRFTFQGGITASGVYHANAPAVGGTDNESLYYEPMIGAHGNVAIIRPITDRFSLAVEPGLVVNRYRRDSEADPLDYCASLFYAQLPVLAQYRPVESLEVVLGPELGYLVRAWAVRPGSDEAFDLTRTLIDRRIKLAAMAGFHVYLAPRVALAARVSYNLLPLYELTLTDNSGTPLSDIRAQLVHGQLSVRYTF